MDGIAHVYAQRFRDFGDRRFQECGHLRIAGARRIGNQPTIGADTNYTNGNSFVYEIKNTGSTNITTAAITVPGLNTGGANGADAEAPQVAWTIVGTRTLSGSGAAGCTVGAVTSATVAGANGSIPITGCNIAAGQVLDISFNGKAPYNINYNYKFSTLVNGAMTAGEGLGERYDHENRPNRVAVLSLNPLGGQPGDTATPSLSSSTPCVFTIPTNTVEYRNIPASTIGTYQDPLMLSVFTDAGTTNTWSLSVQASSNPARTGPGATNELLSAVDQTNSHLPAGVTVNQISPAYAVVPTAGSLTLVTSLDVAPQRKPFEALENFQVSIGTEAIVPQASTITVTFIAN